MDVHYYKCLIGDFARKIGKMIDSERLEALGLIPQNALGLFYSCDVPTLMKFCQNNCRYHIITRVSSRLTVNRYVAGEDYDYNLGDGDKDPNLYLVLPQEIIDHFFAEISLLTRGYKL